MKNLPEKVRLYLTGNTKTKVGSAIYLFVGLWVLFAPAYALEKIYLDIGDAPYVSGSTCILFMGLTEWLKTYTAYAIMRAILWIWAAVAVAQKTSWPVWLTILFYTGMVIGILRLATILWSNDNKVLGPGTKD